MQLFEIAFVACLIACPDTFKDRSIQTLDHAPTFFECFHQAQYPAAEWLADNPEWFFKRINCGPLRVKI
jgi:hypothetical protein